eukprot:1819073-Pyramimonas_sp.AAC.1
MMRPCHLDLQPAGETVGARQKPSSQAADKLPHLLGDREHILDRRDLVLVMTPRLTWVVLQLRETSAETRLTQERQYFSLLSP